MGRYQYADNNPDGGGTEALLPRGVSAGQIRQVMSLELSQSGEILNSPLSISLKQKIYSWKNLSIGLTRTGGTVTATLFPRWQQVLEVVVRFDPRPPTASSVSVRCWGPQTKSNQMKMLHIYLKNVDVWPWWHVLIHIMKWWRIPPNEIILCPRSSLLKNTIWKTQHVSIALAWRPPDFWKMRQSDSATFLPK